MSENEFHLLFPIFVLQLALPPDQNSDFANADDDHHSAAGLVGAPASTCPTDSINHLTHARHGALIWIPNKSVRK